MSVFLPPTPAKTDPDFKAFLAERNPRQQHSSTLESYLIKPIQRVLKYPLLLKELYSLTDPDSEEHYHLDGKPVSLWSNALNPYNCNCNEDEGEYGNDELEVINVPCPVQLQWRPWTKSQVISTRCKSFMRSTALCSTSSSMNRLQIKNR